jgi:lysine 2,3-aminomutase
VSTSAPTVQKGLEIIQALRGWTSGLAVPQFVIDAPWRRRQGAAPPEYVEEITTTRWCSATTEGQPAFRYKQPPAANVPSEGDDRRRADRDVVPIEAEDARRRVAARAEKVANG